MSIPGALARSLKLLSRGAAVCLAGAILRTFAADEAGLAVATPASDVLPDPADFTVPVQRFFAAPSTNGNEVPPPVLPPAARAPKTTGPGSTVGLFHETGLNGLELRNWRPLSRRERTEPRCDPDDFVGRTYYSALGVLEEVGRSLRFDRSYFDDVELRQTTYGGRWREDVYDVRTVFSFRRIGVSVPLYSHGLTAVSLEFNVDRLHRAIRGDLPQLRGGLKARF